MALGAESLPGWRGKPRDEDADSAHQDNTESLPPDNPSAPQATDPDQPGTATTTGGGSSQEPVVVWQADNRLEAQIVKGRLESEGIPAFLSGEALGTIYGLTTGNLAATSVLVPGPLAEKALEILHTEVEWDEWTWDDDNSTDTGE